MKDDYSVFFKSLQKLLKEEGQYVNDKNDLGGESYNGISRKYYPYWEGWKIIDDAKEHFILSSPNFYNDIEKKGISQLVRDFYRINYWNVLNCSEVENERIASQIFEMGVSLGVAKAASLVQIAVNLMNYLSQDELKIDGNIGIKTINLVNIYAEKNANLLLKLLVLQQGDIYVDLATTNKSQRKFIHGWVNRLNIDVK